MGQFIHRLKARYSCADAVLRIRTIAIRDASHVAGYITAPKAASAVMAEGVLDFV